MNDDYFEYLKEMRKTEKKLLDHKKEVLDTKAKINRFRARIYHIINILAIILVFLYLIAFLFFNDNSFFAVIKKLDSSNITLIVLIMTVSAGFFLIRYLQTNSTVKDDDFKDIYLNELSELKYNIEILKNKNGNGNETILNINEIIEEAIKNKFSDKYIEDRIEANYKDQSVKNRKINNLISYIENKSNRLDDEILRLRKSGNLNLVIGSLTTFLAILGLVYEVFFNEIDFKNNIQLLSHYIPRLSLLIFIEFFAFFFLKLYKSNLFEIKYFNNEKTNIDFKIFSLKTAIHFEDKEMINTCINNFIDTERNFIIKKDESTIDLEKHKYDNISNSDLKDLILGIIKNDK
jgi:hypothetical protein